jgi:cell division inhibitor SulA/protein ImuA
MNRAETLQQLAKVCRGDRDDAAQAAIVPSCAPALDAVLPGGGWRAGTIVEVMPKDVGIGELRLLLPALAQITQAERYVAFVSPPFIPYAPALSQHGVNLERLVVIQAQNPKDILWSVEQTLRCRAFGAVLAWPTAARDRDVRRLQLAAEAGDSIGFLYRSPAAALESSPAAVRLTLDATPQGALKIGLLKCRGARGGVSVHVNRADLSASHTQAESAVSDQSLVTNH